MRPQYTEAPGVLFNILTKFKSLEGNRLRSCEDVVQSNFLETLLFSTKHKATLPIFLLSPCQTPFFTGFNPLMMIGGKPFTLSRPCWVPALLLFICCSWSRISLSIVFITAHPGVRVFWFQYGTTVQT